MSGIELLLLALLDERTMFPFDLPAVGDTDLTLQSERYLSSLESRHHKTEEFLSPTATKTAITVTSVKRLRLFEDGRSDCTLLALHPADEPTQVLALYLHEQWWHVDDVLRTSDKSRSGLFLVQSIVERVIVFLLSQVVERSSDEEVLFSLHPRTESCSLLWRDGQAIGFYTVKPKGSLCDSWSGQCYLLPVLDTVLVRKSWRRRGFGARMLENFCSTFHSEKFLGVSSPLSPNWVAVCRRFLLKHEEYRDILYEVEAPGSWTQRRNIWLNIQLGRYTTCINDNSLTPGDQKNNQRNCSSQEFCKANLPVSTVASAENKEPSGPSLGGNVPDSQPPDGLLQAQNTNESLMSLASHPPAQPH